MDHQRIVIKFGTSTLTDGTAKLSLPRIFDLVRQIVQVHSHGYQIVLVSSGAIRAGRERMDFPDLPKFIPAKQMMSAVGQPRLMGIYDQFFSMFGKIPAQVLLNRDDFSHRRRFLNARNTMEALLQHGVIPIVNENDTIATEEIRFGDNDNLSAQVANLIDADLLALLTDQAGLFTGDPRHDPSARLISLIEEDTIPDAVWQAAGGTQNGLGTGGMLTKLQAADLARRAGTTVVIARGSEPDILLKILDNKGIGTCFTPLINKMESRKHYILTGRQSSRMLKINQGAITALEHGGSLLPVGVMEISGKFQRGDSVRVVSEAGLEIAAGLVNYDYKDLKKLCGRHSAEIDGILGYTYGDEVIHRSNLLML